MPDITRDVNPKAASDLANQMEQILAPLGVAVDAAGELLRHYGYQKDPLAPQVAEVVGNAASESYEIAYRRLIEFARRAEGNDVPIRPSGQGGA